MYDTVQNTEHPFTSYYGKLQGSQQVSLSDYSETYCSRLLDTQNLLTSLYFYLFVHFRDPLLALIACHYLDHGQTGVSRASFYAAALSVLSKYLNRYSLHQNQIRMWGNFYAYQRIRKQKTVLGLLNINPIQSGSQPFKGQMSLF